jgi:hypothetical protein
MFQLVRESVIIVNTLFDNVDFVRHEDCCKPPLDDRPEDGHRGADDCEIDLEAGEDDHGGCPPGKVDIRISRCLVSADGIEAPHGYSHDTGSMSVYCPNRNNLLRATYIPPKVKTPESASKLLVFSLGVLKMIMGVKKTQMSRTMLVAECALNSDTNSAVLS